MRVALKAIRDSSVQAFARKARRYRWVYMNMSPTSYSEVEKFSGERKAHRNILDQCTGLFTALLAEYDNDDDSDLMQTRMDVD